MGRYLTKKMFLVLTPILFLISSSSGWTSVIPNENGVCTCKRPYESEGKPPKPANLEFKDLNMCKVFHGKTCCSAALPTASLALENLATYGEAVKDCLNLFELFECSICHPQIGIQPGICASFCDMVFEACSDAYFSSDVSNKFIVPCGASEGIICGKASKWVSNGTAFCDAVSFTVQTTDDSLESSLEPVVESIMKTEHYAWFQDIQKLVREMSLVQQISWLVTHFVIGRELFNRWRYQHQILAIVRRDVRRLVRELNGIALREDELFF